MGGNVLANVTGNPMSGDIADYFKSFGDTDTGEAGLKAKNQEALATQIANTRGKFAKISASPN